MNSRNTFISIFAVAFLYCSCSAPKYIHDESSYQRQKELHSNRSTNVVAEVGMAILSVFSSVAFDSEIEYNPSKHEFKKINLINPTSDTIYVNMLTDVTWDEDDYCDFMDIRIPPKMDFKILVPVETLYNLYFSNTVESEDDEMLQIFTSDLNKIALRPGITVFKDTTIVEKWFEK